MLDHIGWHSVLNLAIGQRAVALVGSMGSSWSAVTLSMMHRYHRTPALGCSLRKGWLTDHTYTRRTAEAAAEMASAPDAANEDGDGGEGAGRVAPSVTCLARLRELCGQRGELFYPGEGAQL